MSHHFLEANGLCYSYPDGTEALKGISFRLDHGEAFGLVVANGAGKSTLLLTIAVLIFPGFGA